MIREIPPPPSFWKTVSLLLRAARVRSLGRGRRQQQLLNNKTGKSSPSALSILGLFGAIFLGLLIHGSAGFLLHTAIEASQRYQAESQGKIVVSNPYFIRGVIGGSRTQDDLQDSVKRQAERIAEHYGGRQKDIEDRLWKEIHDNGGANFISEDDAEPGLKHLTGFTGLPQMVGSLMLLLWLVMMICQGEGMELDLQRRRHPMWEWLLSHPVQPGAVFLAEMLMPISANSIYWFGPVYVGILYGTVYGFGLGIIAAFLAGVPVTIGAACLGKAIEIGVMIRFSPRSRGGILGILSWLGYALLLFSFAGFYMLPRLIMAAGKFLSLIAAFPWPWLSLFLGSSFGGEYNFLAGITFCWALGIAMTVTGVAFSLWGTAKGLSGA